MGRDVTVRIVRRSASPWRGLASASTTTTPSEVTMKPALGRPSDPRPVSPRTTYTPLAIRRATNGGPSDESAAGAPGIRCNQAMNGRRRVTESAARDRPEAALGGRESDVHRLSVHAALVVGPDHRERRFLVRLEREADDRVLADSRRPLEPGDLLFAIRDHDVFDEIRRDRLAVGRAEEAGIHRVHHDGVHRDEVSAGDAV